MRRLNTLNKNSISEEVIPLFMGGGISPTFEKDF